MASRLAGKMVVLLVFQLVGLLVDVLVEMMVGNLVGSWDASMVEPTAVKMAEMMDVVLVVSSAAEMVEQLVD